MVKNVWSTIIYSIKIGKKIGKNHTHSVYESIKVKLYGDMLLG